MCRPIGLPMPELQLYLSVTGHVQSSKDLVHVRTISEQLVASVAKLRGRIRTFVSC